MPAVLIVADDPEFRRRASRVLADRGYDVVGTAATVAQARVGLRDARPDAVLLDVNLPDGDGLAFAQELADADGAVRVLLTSSDAGAAPRRLVERSGAAGFVAKVDLAVADLTPYLGYRA
jgi:two-component system, NarL family, response regulator DevR